MPSKLKIHIQGYGKVTVRVPKKANRKEIIELVGQAVGKTMQLVQPTEKRWHPALGFEDHAG